MNGSPLTILSSAPAADDQPVRFLVLASGALAERRHAPGRDRVTAALRLALAPTVGVVDRIHRRAAHGRALATPAAAARLPARDVLVIDVADLADRRSARQRDSPQLSGGEAQDAVALVLGDELDACARAARE